MMELNTTSVSNNNNHNNSTDEGLLIALAITCGFLFIVVITIYVVLRRIDLRNQKQMKELMKNDGVQLENVDNHYQVMEN